MLACLLVLLHTLVHSSFAATSAPCNPNKVFASLIYFYTGGSRRLLLCSPAGRCGLIGLSQFLWSLPCVFCRVRSVIPQSCIPSFTPQRHPTQELSFNRPFRFIPLISLLGAFVFSTHNSCGCSIVPLRSTKLHRPTQKPLTVQSLHFSSLPHFVQPLLFPTHSLPKQKLRQPCRIRQPSAALILRAVCCQRPCSTRSRLAPLHYAGKKQLRYCSACFLPLRSGSRLLYLFSV